MTNAGARAHHLNVAGTYLTDIAETVPMRDHALVRMGDDLHVGVRVKRETAVWRDLIVVQARSAPHRRGASFRLFATEM